MRLEEDGARSIMPRPPHPEENLPVACQLERVLGHWRAQDVSAEVLEPLSVTRRRSDACVQVEATGVSPALGDGGAERRIRVAADALDRLPRATAGRHSAENRGSRDPREADGGMTIAVAGTSVFDARAPVATNIRLLRSAYGLLRVVD
jgi:hypothetical protein